jgi:hypothetical protein
MENGKPTIFWRISWKFLHGDSTEFLRLTNEKLNWRMETEFLVAIPW